MTYASVKELLIENLTRVGTNRITGPEILEAAIAILDYAAAIDVEDAIPQWTNLLTFQLDGSDAGKYCKHPDTNGKERIFETKIAGNIANEPPTNPGVTENTEWKEISSSAGSGIVEWVPGLYGPGLIIVYYQHSTDGRGLYLLLEPVRPFTSANIEDEIVAGQWVLLAGTSNALKRWNFATSGEAPGDFPTELHRMYVAVDDSVVAAGTWFGHDGTQWWTK